MRKFLAMHPSGQQVLIVQQSLKASASTDPNNPVDWAYLDKVAVNA